MYATKLWPKPCMLLSGRMKAMLCFAWSVGPALQGALTQSLSKEASPSGGPYSCKLGKMCPHWRPLYPQKQKACETSI